MLGDALIPEINALSKDRIDLSELQKNLEGKRSSFDSLFEKFLIVRYGHDTKNHVSHKERNARFLQSKVEISRISLGVHFADQK